MAALIGTEYLSGQTASGSAVTALGPQTQDVAFLAGAIPAYANVSVSTGSGTTLSASNLISGIISRSGPSSNFTDTTDTAANIIAALAANTPNSWARFLTIRNTTIFVQTLAAGASVTLAGDIIVPGNGFLLALVQKTSSSLVTITGLLSGFDAGYSTNGGSFTSTLAELLGNSTTGIYLPTGFFAPQISAAGINPGGTGADNVLAAFTLPANSFDGVRNRGIRIKARGSFASNGNTKRIKIIFNPSTAVVGSTVGSGGTTIADTGAVTTNGGGWFLEGSVFKYGAANANTQITFAEDIYNNNVIAPVLATATENASILVAVTGNATTATTDIVQNALTIQGVN